MPAPSAAAISAVSASRVIMVPVGLAGLATSTPLQRLLAMRGEQRLGGQRVPRVGVWFRSAPARSRAPSEYADTADSRAR